MKIINYKEIDKYLKEIKKIIKEDGIIIFPTETVYGIAAQANSKKAVDKLYEFKKRPREKAINIMVSDKKQIEKYAIIKNDNERKIIENFMPGEITIILAKKENFGKDFTQKDNTIGIRIPNNNIALKILKEVNTPLIVSSANISGMANGINPEEIKKHFQNTVDILIDGGVLENAVPSTIVKIENNKIKIIREGKIKKEEIEKIILQNI